MIAYVRTDGIYNDSRATKEITSLLDSGYSVLVIGWDRSGSASEKCKLVFENKTDIEFAFFDSKVNHIGIKNINKLLDWFGFVKSTLFRYTSVITAVHACNLDAGIPCYQYCKKTKKPMIYDIYDYYIDAHRLPKMLVPVIENIEIKIINFSCLSIICTEERKEQIKKSKPQKLVVIHNSPSVSKSTFEKNPAVKYDYFYCGVLGGGRLIHEMLAENDGHLKMGFAGYGDYISNINEINSKYANIEYLGEISYSECLCYEQQSICLSAIYQPSIRNHKLCAPNKFYEALALGKPVIVCRGTGIDKIVEKNNIGVVIDYDPRQFYEAIDKLKNDLNYCNDVRDRARKLYDEVYSWDIMSKRLIESYTAIAKPDRERINI